MTRLFTDDQITELSVDELLAAAKRLSLLLGDEGDALGLLDEPRDSDWDPYSACRPKPRPLGEVRLELRLENITIVEQEHELDEVAQPVAIG